MNTNSNQASSADQSIADVTATESQIKSAEQVNSLISGTDTTAPELTAGAEPAGTSLITSNSGEQLLSPVSDGVAQLLQLLDIGGPVVWILLILSVFALSIVLLKLWQFALLRPESTQDVNQALAMWRTGEAEAALSSLNNKKPVSKLVALAIQGISQGTEQSVLQEELSRQANASIQQLRSLFRPLEVIASLSPLLGLMGTVLGMIVAFQQMEAAGNQIDPSVLSGGIWQALLTTAVGLAVAIPVAAAHSWLDRKAERIAHLLNDSVTQVFTLGNIQPAPSALTGVTSCAA